MSCVVGPSEISVVAALGQKADGSHRALRNDLALSIGVEEDCTSFSGLTAALAPAEAVFNQTEQQACIDLKPFRSQ